MCFVAHAAYDPQNPSGIPLLCMGKCDLTPHDMTADEVCESWLGPGGEQVYWIRPHAERFGWYVGGDPIAAKRVETRAYFYFGPGSLAAPRKSLLSFRDAFAGLRVKKVMCTQVQGLDVLEIGFSPPDELDERRIDYFNRHCTGDTTSRVISVPYKMDFDFRFCAKLALAVGFAVFGEEYLHTGYAAELRKALWFRGTGEPPGIRGVAALQADADPIFKNNTGRPHLVSIVVMRVTSGLAMVLNLGQQHVWKLLVSPDTDGLNSSAMDWVGAGRLIILSASLEAGLEMTWHEFMGHSNGRRPHGGLSVLEARLHGAAPSG